MPFAAPSAALPASTAAPPVFSFAAVSAALMPSSAAFIPSAVSLAALIKSTILAILSSFKIFVLNHVK